MFPKTIRPNIETDVNIQILESQGPVNVVVSLEDSRNNVISSNNAVITKGTSYLYFIIIYYIYINIFLFRIFLEFKKKILK